MDRPHFAEERAIGKRRGEADQVGVVVLLLGRRRQRRARQIEAQPAQRLGLVAVGNPGEAGDDNALGAAGEP